MQGHRTAVPAQSRQHRGFTLLEIMVVVAIIAIGSAVVAIQWPDSQLRALEREGTRLAAILESARVHSRASGNPLQWRVTEQGFAFEGPDKSWIAARPTRWESPNIVALVERPVTLGPQPLLPAQAVVLSWRGNPQLRVRVATDGLHPFAVQTR
ncbi:type II secretion system protein GspH [Lampropedia puyangensis]|uniref:Type II secretion system protein GspH n=1 Tax=Lampropedia puyangensis TaxID=1330072 RepID=A0A4S8FD82_9BURK|nr:type II secretion system protein [Lampropedia puyangensis]THU04564.1 type II secretion system protein GspH [Lampropedia puyangensis]